MFTPTLKQKIFSEILKKDNIIITCWMHVSVVEIHKNEKRLISLVKNQIMYYALV